MAKTKPDSAINPQGADIEIIDRSAGTPGVVLPNAVRVNGTEILIPSDATIRVSDIAEDELVTVTLTMFARSLSIRHEPVDTQDP
ncbi:hypothetical protein ACWGIU_02460 [Streptomyces sp. NPDC054840]